MASSPVNQFTSILKRCLYVTSIDEECVRLFLEGKLEPLLNAYVDLDRKWWIETCDGAILEAIGTVDRPDLVDAFLDRRLARVGKNPDSDQAAKFLKYAIAGNSPATMSRLLDHRIIEVAPGGGVFGPAADLLCEAARQGSPEMGRLLMERLSAPADSARPKAPHMPVAHVAAACGNDAFLRWLLDQRGANPLRRPDNGETLLQEGAGYLPPETLRWLAMEKKLPFDRTDRNGNTPLHMAARNLRADNARVFLDLGVPVDPCNGSGLTPFLMAAGALGDTARKRTAEEARKTMGLLLERGADPNRTDFEGRNALAVMVDRFRYLSPGDGNPAAHLERALDLLAQAGVDLTSPDNDGGNAVTRLLMRIHSSAKDEEAVEFTLAEKLIARGVPLPHVLNDGTSVRRSVMSQSRGAFRLQYEGLLSRVGARQGLRVEPCGDREEPLL